MDATVACKASADRTAYTPNDGVRSSIQLLPDCRHQTFGPAHAKLAGLMTIQLELEHQAILLGVDHFSGAYKVSSSERKLT